MAQGSGGSGRMSAAPAMTRCSPPGGPPGIMVAPASHPQQQQQQQQGHAPPSQQQQQQANGNPNHPTPTTSAGATHPPGQAPSPMQSLISVADTILPVPSSPRSHGGSPPGVAAPLVRTPSRGSQHSPSSSGRSLSARPSIRALLFVENVQVSEEMSRKREMSQKGVQCVN